MSALRLPLLGIAPDRVSHAGLILTRYLEHRQDGTTAAQQARQTAFDRAKSATRTAAPLYRLAFQRWVGAVPAGGLTFPVRTADGGRLIVGLGGHHVLETGITLHHTYGVPYLPGTAIKGLASHFCHTVWGSVDPTFRADTSDGVCHQFLFGTQEIAGAVRFHDAWMHPDSVASALTDDVMTPHHGDYYMTPDSPPPPSDFDSPVPVSFLAVVGTFLVPLSLQPGLALSSQETADWLALTRKLVTDALAVWGIGGKTGAGYGRLVLAD